jgi:hypothetical protein
VAHFSKRELTTRHQEKANKIAKLEVLRGQIKRKYGPENVWFLEKIDGYSRLARVNGFLGTQDIAFIGLNPSTSRFPTNADKYFYSQLLRHGFDDAHLSDLVKIKAENKKNDFVCGTSGAAGQILNVNHVY